MQEQPPKPQDDLDVERPINGARRDQRVSVEAPVNAGREAHTPRPHPPIEERIKRLEEM